MELPEAQKLVRDAIRAGIFNDLGSGSNVDITIIKRVRRSQIIQICVCACHSCRVYRWGVIGESDCRLRDADLCEVVLFVLFFAPSSTDRPCGPLIGRMHIPCAAHWTCAYPHARPLDVCISPCTRAGRLCGGAAELRAAERSGAVPRAHPTARGSAYAHGHHGGEWEGGNQCLKHR